MSRSNLIKVIIILVATILVTCLATSCSSPSQYNTEKPLPLKNIIELYQYTVTYNTGVTVNAYCYAADKYDAQRMFDAKCGDNYRSSSIKEIATINKPFAVFR